MSAKPALWISALAAIGFAGSASAAVNLVQNGGMETLSSGAANQWYSFGARLADWTLTPAPGNFGTQGVVFGPGAADTTGATFAGGIPVGLWGPGNGSANGLPATSPAGGNYFGADDPVNGYNQILSQTINGLTAGREYALNFYWAAAQVWEPSISGYNGASQNQIVVSLGAQTFTTPLETIKSHGFSGWLNESVDFTATGASETLSFLFASPTPGGAPPIALLDGVSLTAVPEPSIWALLGLGFAGIGFAAHRRAKKNAAAFAA
jgi:PEP-CTERM motif